jgi:hypothetical protein
VCASTVPCNQKARHQRDEQREGEGPKMKEGRHHPWELVACDCGMRARIKRTSACGGAGGRRELRSVGRDVVLTCMDCDCHDGYFATEIGLQMVFESASLHHSLLTRRTVASSTGVRKVSICSKRCSSVPSTSHTVFSCGCSTTLLPLSNTFPPPSNGLPRREGGPSGHTSSVYVYWCPNTSTTRCRVYGTSLRGECGRSASIMVGLALGEHISLGRKNVVTVIIWG